MNRIVVLLVVIVGYLDPVRSMDEDVRRRFCGQRLSGVRKLNRTAKSEFSIETFASDKDTFPWMVRVRTEDTMLCAGIAISPYVALTSAHCLVGAHKSLLKVEEFEVENIIVHPDYVQGHPSHMHDLALVKVRDTASAGFEMFACLPEHGDDPVDDCQVADYIQYRETVRILAHDIEFGPSVVCAEETPHLRGYLDNPDAILCSENVESCSRFVTGPVFCPNGDSSDYAVVGLSTDAANWCSVGAYTRLARYSDWIIKGIQYLEGEPVLQRDQHSREPGGRERGAGFDEEKKKQPCASNPCGANAACWNSGEDFMCLCSKDGYLKGNPYKSCHECLYDQHCNPDLAVEPSKCVNNTCRSSSSRNLNDDFDDIIIPRFYKRLGPRRRDFYYVSDEELTWTRAQNECQNRKGHLAEVENRSRFPFELVKSLRGKLDSTGDGPDGFWVGATDLFTEDKFVWYSTDADVSESNWHKEGRRGSNGTEHACLTVDESGYWISNPCEMKKKFICQYDPSLKVDVDNPVDGSNRNQRQREFFDTLNPKAHYKDVCGRRFVRSRGGRIVGGTLADYGEWPWQVSLKQFKNGQYRHKCGAALLTHQWVVTAAHCVKDVSPSNLQVRVGEHNTYDTTESHPHVDVRITRVTVHVKFDRASYEYDIAVLRMARPVLFQPNIIPICLPSTNDYLAGKTGVVTGWGRISEYGRIAPILREVHLPILTNRKCMSMYRRSGQEEYIPDIFLCAGTSNGGKDSCEGDSGGPLVVRGPNNRFELAGIISWGIGCGDRNRPGVYTRISEFREWIKRNSNYL